MRVGRRAWDAGRRVVVNGGDFAYTFTVTESALRYHCDGDDTAFLFRATEGPGKELRYEGAAQNR